MVSPDELRALFLFADLSDNELAWVVEHGEVVHVSAGEVVLPAGAASAHFVVLLDGELVIEAVVGGEHRRAVASTQPGVYAGGLALFDRSVPIAAHAGHDSRMLRFTQEELSHMLRRGFPGVGYHLLEGVEGARAALSTVSQQDKLAALGKLSAGLAHELNNPASAAARSAARLRHAVAAVREAARTAGDIDPELLEGLRAGTPATPEPDPLARSDLEDALAGALADRGVAEPYRLAPALAAAGLTAGALERIPKTDRDQLERALRLVASDMTAHALIDEIGAATTRIVDLVQAMKSFTFRDQAHLQAVDVHAGLDSTVTLLSNRILGKVRVERDYADDLPLVEARGAELNQVWMNLLDNALDALGDAGRIVVRTRAHGEQVLVTISDDGPGIPDDLADRIFDPFVSTKEVGHGTGLGLDIAQRIVRSHGGTLELDRDAPETTFRVRMPIRQRPPSPGRA